MTVNFHKMVAEVLNNPLPDFFSLLDDAHATSAEVDNFDLDSNDPASVAAFDKLTKAETAAVKALVEFVQERGAAIIRWQERSHAD